VEDSGGDILLTSIGVYNGVTRTVHQQETMVINPPDPRMLVAVAGSWGTN